MVSYPSELKTVDSTNGAGLWLARKRIMPFSQAKGLPLSSFINVM